MRCGLIAMLMGLAVVASALEAPINLMETAGAARAADPVSVGVPMPRGALKEADVSRLCVLSPEGKKIPAQFDVTAWWWPTPRYPDAEKTVRWVLVDFQADVPANGTAAYRLTDQGGNPAPETPVTITDRRGAVAVETGPLAFSVNGKSFRLFDEVSFQGRRVVSAARTDGLCIAGMDGKRYYASRDVAAPPEMTDADYRGGHDNWLQDCRHNPPEKLRVVVEKAGPVRSTVMIDGVMQAMRPGGEHEFVQYTAEGDKGDALKVANRDEKLGFRIRIHAYAGKSFVRVFHTIINLSGNSHTSTDQNRYRSAAYIADAIQKQPGCFLVEALELSTSLALQGDKAYILAGDKLHTGKLAGGQSVAMYQDSSAGWIWQVAEEKVWDPLLKANMEFLNVKPGLEKPYHEYSDIHYKILTGQDGCTFMGYRVSDGAGKALAAGNRAAGWADVSDGNVGLTTAVRWFWKMFPKSIEVDSSGAVTVGLLPRQWSRGHFLDGKIHRTHELLYRFHAAEDPAATRAAADAFETPLVAHSGIDWYLETRACNFFARPDLKNWPNYEGQQFTAVHELYNKKVNASFDSSHAVEREKEDHFGWQHFGDTAKRGFRGHSQFEEFDTSRCLLMHFFRTGDPAFFQTAEELDRWLMGVPCFGGGYGHQHPESSHNWIQGLIDYYCLTGLPEAGEAIEAMQGFYQRCRTPQAQNWNYNGRNAAYALNGLRQMFERTGDPSWLADANTCIRHVKQRTRPVSGFYGGNPGWFMSHVLCHALGRYAELTGDEDAVDLLLGLAGHFKPFSGRCDGGGESADCYAHATMLTGDRRYLDAAAATLKDGMAADDKGPHFRTGDCSSKTWSGSVGGYWQVFFHAAREWKPADTVLPDQVADLAAEPGPKPGSVRLTWTNTGDDGKNGRAAKVQIKHAPGEIVEFIPWARKANIEADITDEWKGKVNFWYADNAVGEPQPEAPGAKQSWVLEGLPSGKTLHFALCLHDEAGNRGKPSKSAAAAVP